MERTGERRARMLTQAEMMERTGFVWYKGWPGMGLHDQPAYMTRARIYLSRGDCFEKIRTKYELGRTFRLWTDMPTPEQCAGVAWEREGADV